MTSSVRYKKGISTLIQINNPNMQSDSINTYIQDTKDQAEAAYKAAQDLSTQLATDLATVARRPVWAWLRSSCVAVEQGCGAGL